MRDTKESLSSIHLVEDIIQIVPRLYLFISVEDTWSLISLHRCYFIHRKYKQTTGMDPEKFLDKNQLEQKKKFKIWEKTHYNVVFAPRVFCRGQD